MWRNRRAVLIGNPGVSKSWFQWYMMYRLVSEDEYNTKLIIRQVGTRKVDFYFPRPEKGKPTAFTSLHSNLSSLELVSHLDPETSVYLFEPGNSVIEPEYDVNYDIRLFSTCSPNEVRYKEFCKNGAMKVYMPCWTLKELKSVGSHIAEGNSDLKDLMHPQAIEKRYKRFGGIIRYVIPTSEGFLNTVKAKQNSVLKVTTAVDAFAPYANIEKSDDQKKNISHFILTYDVEYGDKYKKGMKYEEFTGFRMKIASEYVKNSLAVDITEQDLLVAIKSLQGMLKYGHTQDPLLFETVVYNSIIKCQHYKWQVFDQEEWIDHDWGLNKKKNVNIHIKNGEFVEDGKKMCVENLKPGILYRPALKNFPVADMFFVKEKDVDKKEKEVFAIQVTFSSTHTIKKTAYEAFYKGLQLDPKTDAVTFYIVSSSTNAESYAKAIAKGSWSYFITPVKGSKNYFPKIRFVAARTSTDFNVQF